MPAQKMQIGEFQELIRARYEKRDRQRGTAATFMWFVEEVGELATALSDGDDKSKAEEFADVFAWLCTLANINDIDMEEACRKYTSGDISGFK
jgi:NTP pyrophosphatase (non-canonical NTP hydrolase)